VSWILYTSESVSRNETESVPLFNNITGVPSEDGQIIYNTDSEEEGVSPFALFENKTYRWELKSSNTEDDIILDSPLINSGRKKSEWNIGLSGGYGDFCVKNYLGSSYIQKAGDEVPFFHFDIISYKLNYYSEYRNLVEAVAEQCSQLLLEWDSPVTFSFTPDAEADKRIALEQFLFLRNVLKPDNLQLYLEVIGRNPDNHLTDEAEWKPSDSGYDPGFLIDPVRNGRGWIKTDISCGIGDNSIMPEEILMHKRYETLNTPANRFIKHALNVFRDVTVHVIELLEKDNPYQTSLLEAKSMLSSLDVFLALPFFRDVDVLNYIPYNSQVLQKREGYRQILHAWLMLEAASRLDWEGKGDAYEGTNRDAAVMYEYWLYFVLFSILRSIKGFTYHTSDVSDTVPDFIRSDDEGMTVNLKSGKASRACFSSENVSINLYYNRSFSGSSDSDSKTKPSSELFRSNSYSRRLRPDYSIVIFPKSMTEEDAEIKGITVWLHFDAKYRADVFTEFFGGNKDDSDNKDSDEKELNEEKLERAYSVYKRGDLYKMHTYNEAIRRTAGSYVLYPGSKEQIARFDKYLEILPGVGAFPVRPSENPDMIAEGAPAVKSFVEDVIKTQIDTYTDYYRINYWTNNTVVRDDHSVYIRNNNTPASDIAVAVLPLRDDEIYNKCCELGYFYFHSEYSGQKTVNRRLLIADYILPVRMKGGKPYGYLFKIINIKPVLKEELKNDLNSVHFKGTADIYFRSIIDKNGEKYTGKYIHNSNNPYLTTQKDLMDFTEWIIYDK